MLNILGEKRHQTQNKVKNLLAEVTDLDGRTKAGDEANAAEELTTLGGCI